MLPLILAVVGGYLVGDSIKDNSVFADGGVMDEGVDLFEDYENIPADVQEVLERHQDAFMDGDYIGMGEALDELEPLGYTFEFYVDGSAYDLRKIGQRGKSESVMANGGDVYEKNDYDGLDNKFWKDIAHLWRTDHIDYKNGKWFNTGIYKGVNNSSNLYFTNDNANLIIGLANSYDVNLNDVKENNPTFTAFDYYLKEKERKFEEGGEISRSNQEMVSSQVKAIKHHAEELSNLVTDKTPIEAWVVSKIERSETDLSDVTHYLDGLKYGDGGMMDDDDDDDGEDYDVVIVYKDSDEDGGKKYRERYFDLNAPSFRKAKSKAIRLWEEKYEDSDLEIIEILSHDDYRNKYIKFTDMTTKQGY